MVKSAPPVYLLIGTDSLSKETEFRKLKTQFLPEKVRDFNLDILSAIGLRLNALQERLLCLPVESAKRVVVIKDAQVLPEDIRSFLKDYIPKARPEIILVLDFDRDDTRDEFTKFVCRYAQKFSFFGKPKPDTFTLSRQIGNSDTHGALRVLRQLLSEGEKPERIMGGLRYDWERNSFPAREMGRRIKLLLTCDVEIKTGRLKPDFALEKLVISLCAFK
ncbi:MAG: hypothetical protein NT033_06345 [Candidatus Omnitrophica bacterium]|nr:hypothetical protein [Candidatus Omnitrophota bacterium]